MENVDYNFKLVLLPGANNFGLKVHKNIQRILGSENNFVLTLETPRFNIGESKGIILNNDSARNQKIFILQDVTNASVKYKLRGCTNHYTPDEHYQDIKRAIGAIKGHCEEISVIMPYMYQGRQHKAGNKESRDCAIALQELIGMGVKRIITYDIHNEGVWNAIPLTETNSIWATNPILELIINEENLDFDNLVTVSPDKGAVDRNGYWRDLFDCESGYFDKVRDRANVIDGKNPIKKHVFVGGSLQGKTVILIDDMIDSGNSMIDSIKQANEKGAKKVYVITSFPLFTRGYEKFDNLYENGMLEKVYSTNLVNLPQALKRKAWFKSADCSKQLAEFIIHYNDHESLAPITEIDSELALKLVQKKEQYHQR